MTNEASFTAADTAVFVLSIFISLATGVYFAYTDRNDKSTASYFNGRGQMAALPVGLSLAASFVSSITLMGYPTEVYYYGTIWFWSIICYPLVVLTTCNYFLPMYYNLNIQCIYDYLELRFNRNVRILGSVFAIFNLMTYLSVVCYYPAVSLSIVMPITINWSIAITITICGLYTVIGGFKSVIWTDTFQSIIMLSGCATLLVNLAIKYEPSEAFESIQRGNRNNWDTFSFNPFIRYTFWSLLSGIYLDWMITMTTSQPSFQRYVSCKTVNTAKRSLYASLLLQSPMTCMSLITGVYLYAKYERCDPHVNGEIERADQLLPYAVVTNTRNMPGFSGLFVATVYSCTFSTISSGLNSMVVIIMEEFVSLKWKFRKEENKLRCSKLCGVVLSALLLIVSYLSTKVASSFMQIIFTVPSAFGATIFSIFFLGMFVPWANSTGTMIGATAGFTVSLWLAIGTLLHQTNSQKLDVSIGNCTIGHSNITADYNTVFQNSTHVTEELGNSVYDISFGYIRIIAIVIAIPVGILASFVTGPEDPKQANPRLFVPLVSSSLFPAKFVKFMRFGVPIPHSVTQEVTECLKVDSPQ